MQVNNNRKKDHILNKITTIAMLLSILTIGTISFIINDHAVFASPYVTVKIGGEVIRVIDEQGTESQSINTFGTPIKIGDTVNGCYTYDLATQDTSPSNPESGTYPWVASPEGIKVNINNLTFGSDANRLHGGTTVVDGKPGIYADEIMLVSLENMLTSGQNIPQITLYYINRTGNAHDTDALPNLAPSIPNPWNENTLYINGPGESFIAAKITTSIQSNSSCIVTCEY